ncbi:DUF3025 domain-containing protein [Burkholderiaceae bacterium DAT-1]|nr:DUF3025 domain-containing protein [Burkholderiaceae bacterium DAT-1]
MAAALPSPTADWHCLDHASPWFGSIYDLLCLLQTPTFPDLAALNMCAQTHLAPLNLPTFVPGDSMVDGYERFIARHDAVPTRSQNWHDLFNALCWMGWPTSKRAMNRLHMSEIATQSGSQRTEGRDTLTLLDESGVVIPYADATLWQAIIQHDWHSLFVTHRAAWSHHITALIIGHALLEKAVAPYPGITAKVIGMPVEPAFFLQQPAMQRDQADQFLAGQLPTLTQANAPRLPVLPLSGIPGFWPEQDAAFYANKQVFRPKR